ncbi:MAG: phytanoyl-CoA dioxygenase family protein [Geminicoccaceae bacterium]
MSHEPEDAAVRDFERDGFVIVSGLVPAALCEATVDAFQRDILPSRAFFKRQESGAVERHRLTPFGHMKFPIMNIQDLGEPAHASFRQAGLAVLTHPGVRDTVASLLGRPGRIAHTMFFDGNPQTWAHRDGHYIDAEATGRMVGVLVAVEDIEAGAGRFFVCRGTHRLPDPPDLAAIAEHPNATAYKRHMARLAEALAPVTVAPALRRGDAIFWSGLTIHGSLPTTTPEHSRRSLTAHWIPAGERYRWERRTVGADRWTSFQGIEIARHGSQPGTWAEALRGQLRWQLRRRAPALLRQLKAARDRLAGGRAG